MSTKGGYKGLLTGAMDKLRSSYRGVDADNANQVAPTRMDSDSMTVDNLTQDYHAVMAGVSSRRGKQLHEDPRVQQLEATLAYQVLQEVDSSLSRMQKQDGEVRFCQAFDLSPTYRETFCRFYEEPELRVSEVMLNGLLGDDFGPSYQ